jgi:hypothetical protein
MKNVIQALGFFVLLVLVAALIILVPFGEIWALNQLFSLGLEMTIWNWFAVVILNFAMKSGRYNWNSSE